MNTITSPTVATWHGTISVFNSITDNRAKELPINWSGLVELLETPKVLTDKSHGQLLTGAAFLARARRKDTVKTSCLLMLDYDHAPPMQEALAAWQSYGHLAYTTWSHGTDEKGHAYRVIVPLAEPIAAADYPALWQWASQQSGGLIDVACKDVSRIMYLPACPDDRRGLFQFVKHEGAALDWRALNLSQFQQQTTTKPERATIKRDAAAPLGRYVENALTDEMRRVATAAEGTRNTALNTAAFNLGGILAAPWSAQIITESECERALLAAGTTAGLSEQEALTTIKSGSKNSRNHRV